MAGPQGTAREEPGKTTTMNDRLPPYRMFLASDSEIRDLLRDLRTVAGFGVDQDERAAGVLTEMRAYGYRVIAVLSDPKGAPGIRVVGSLADVEEKVEIVCVFGDPEQVPAAAARAADHGARVLWLERDVVHAEAAYAAHQRGLKVVMNRGLLDEYEMHFPDDEVGYPEEL